MVRRRDNECLLLSQHIQLRRSLEKKEKMPGAREKRIDHSIRRESNRRKINRRS